MTQVSFYEVKFAKALNLPFLYLSCHEKITQRPYCVRIELIYNSEANKRLYEHVGVFLSMRGVEKKKWENVCEFVFAFPQFSLCVLLSVCAHTAKCGSVCASSVCVCMIHESSHPWTLESRLRERAQKRGAETTICPGDSGPEMSAPSERRHSGSGRKV